MPSISRWCYFDPNTDTTYSHATNQTVSGTGSRGYVEASTATSGTFTITAGAADQMQVAIDGNALQQITLTSGSTMDARAVARDIEWKLKQLPQTEFDNCRVEYLNNKFRIWSSTLGTASTVAVDNGSNDCLHLLGMAASQGGSLTVNTVNGLASANNGSFTGQVSLSGVYKGQFTDIYTVLVGTVHPIGVVSGTGGNVYTGSGTSTGSWNEAFDETYTVTINTAAGSVMNNGAGNVPTMTWTSTSGDNSGAAVQLLYSDYFYAVGSRGLRIRFTDSPFGNSDLFGITCSAIQFSSGAVTSSAVGTARYHWSSLREGKSSASTVSQVTGTAVGNKGLTIAFSNSGNLTRRDRFEIIAGGPVPTTIGVTVLNFGAVTVSTYSSTKSVWFDLLSGATVLSSPRFGLNSNGTAQNHYAGGNGTKFAVGFSGRGNPASDGTEWRKAVVGSTDLSSDVPPAYLFSTEDNMPEVSTALDSIAVGVAPGEMTTDFIHLAIRLDALETGSNPSIVYRIFYDFS